MTQDEEKILRALEQVDEDWCDFVDALRSLPGPARALAAAQRDHRRAWARLGAVARQLCVSTLRASFLPIRLHFRKGQ